MDARTQSNTRQGSSFRSAYNRITGTVLGGMAGIAALEWCGLTSPLAIVAAITAWTLFCCFSRRSAVYGETAVVAALTCPIIMLGPINGEEGSMLRVEQTVLGCLIYSVIDNLLYPVRAKIDLRRELVASLDTFRQLLTSAFNVFLDRGGGKEEAARAQASYVRLTVGEQRHNPIVWTRLLLRITLTAHYYPSAHTGELRAAGAIHRAGPGGAGDLAQAVPGCGVP